VIHIPALLPIPVLVPVVAMLYWLWRIRVRKTLRGIIGVSAPQAVLAVSFLIALQILARPDYLNTFEVSQLNSLARLIRSSHGLGFTVVFIFLGLGSTVFAYLLLKARYVPPWLAGFGVFSSSLLVICALLMIVFPSAVQVLQVVSFAPMGIYEITIGAWLWLRGADIKSRLVSVA